jgi:hypothetical protein
MAALGCVGGRTAATVKFTRAVRTKVAKASEGGPSIATWLTRIEAIGHPVLTEAIEGIWAGRSGEVRLELPGANCLLCLGWHEKRVEWSYLS